MNKPPILNYHSPPDDRSPPQPGLSCSPHLLVLCGCWEVVVVALCIADLFNPNWSLVVTLALLLSIPIWIVNTALIKMILLDDIAIRRTVSITIAITLEVLSMVAFLIVFIRYR